MTVHIHRMPGELPPFWQDRRAIFFANLLSLFFGNEEETMALRKEVGRIASYGGRLVPVINTLFRGGNNLLVVDQAPNDALVDYFQHSLGLSLPEIEVLPYDEYRKFINNLREKCEHNHDGMERIALHAAEWVDGFVTDDGIADLAQVLGKSTLSSVDGSKKGNNKLLLHRFLKNEGLPVFETIEVDSKADIPSAWKELQKKGFRRAVAKAPIGASGIGLEPIRNDQDAENISEFLFDHGPCMVQGWLDKDAEGIVEIFSPSVQLFTDHDGVYLYDITEQILSDESIHQGNQAPPPYMKEAPEVKTILLDQAECVGRWLNNQNYRGTASIDFILLKKTDSWEAIVCEVNARVTGATYPAVLARKFMPGGSWVMRNLLLEKAMTGDEVLSAMRKENCLYEPGRTNGIIPINFNLNSQNEIDKGQFLCIAEDGDGCWEQMEEIDDALPINWSIDRD